MRDSSADASVQLADGAVDAAELEAEFADIYVVGKGAPVALEPHLLHDLEPALHRVTHGRGVAADHDVDRAGRVAERAGEMVRAVGPHDPFARAHWLVALVHGVD